MRNNLQSCVIASPAFRRNEATLSFERLLLKMLRTLLPDFHRNDTKRLWSMVYGLWTIILTFSLQFASAQSPQEIFNTANTHYQNNEFQMAAEQYEKIISLGYESEAAYYNLGNCYFKLNEIGRSILNYERALKAAPDNEDIQFNLKLANLRVADRIEPVPQMMLIAWTKNILSALTADGWGAWALIFAWTSLLVLAAYLFVNRLIWKRVSFFAGIIFLFFSISFLLIAGKQNNFEKSHRFGIVMVTNTYIKSAPALNATDLFILREGVKAEILEEADGWQKLKLADGKVGWIQEAHLEVI
jgi:tetratricopeptide (TPR) repeat protein